MRFPAQFLFLKEREGKKEKKYDFWMEFMCAGLRGTNAHESSYACMYVSCIFISNRYNFHENEDFVSLFTIIHPASSGCKEIFLKA